MFRHPTNGACNNEVFNAGTIPAMHESAARLYEFVSPIGLKTQAAIAKALNESSQTVNNWEARGVSVGGALKAQGKFGCDANWVLSGAGHKLAGWPFSFDLLQEVRTLRAPELHRMENVMRSHLGLNPIGGSGLQLVAPSPRSLQLNNDGELSSGYSGAGSKADDALSHAEPPKKAGRGNAGRKDHGKKLAGGRPSGRGASGKGKGR